MKTSDSTKIQTRDELRAAVDELLERLDLPTSAVVAVLSDTIDDLERENWVEPTEDREPECTVEVYAALPEDVDIRKVDMLMINLRHDLGVDVYHLERDATDGMLRSTTGSQTLPNEYAASHEDALIDEADLEASASSCVDVPGRGH